MKKILAAVLSLAALCCATKTYAQFGIEAGYTNSGYYFKSNGTSENTAKDNNYDLNGFYVGATYDFNIVDELYVSPGVAYNYLSKSRAEDLSAVTMRRTTTDHYLNIPVMLKYKIGFGDIQLVVGAGPTASLGISSSAKFTFDGTLAGLDVDGKYRYNYYTGRLKYNGKEYSADGTLLDGKVPTYRYSMFDVMLGVNAAAVFKERVQLKLGYDFGLLDRCRIDAMSMHRNQLYITLGILF